MAEPFFIFHRTYLDAMRKLFNMIILPKETQRILSATLTAKNIVVELTGTYGVAKSTFALSVMKMFF
ncbi:MAG: hypothetical protein QW599_05970, partial [Nitrososphaerota archaeon]